ncbi:MAG: response regulator transcription factor [Ruminococcaceae bacterium]|nr:response regulator transcription factor [Oscillospiraceae bacterium]
MDKLILVIEDEAPIVEILKFNLTKSGYRVLTAFDGEEGYRLAISEKPDLILLDVMLPKMDGFEVCKKVREKQSTPIIMLTARDEEVDKVLGLELGADDYCTKPFSVRELMARVKANIRRTSADAPASESVDLITFQNLTVNPSRYEVSKDGKVIDLTLREFELLKFLAIQPGQIFTRETLLEKVWGYEYFGDVRTVDVTVRRLREKVEDNPASPNFIMTKRGVGYYFNK